MNLSLIIPVLDEAAQLPELFAHLQPFKRSGCEIVFADGGSADDSARLVAAAGFALVQSARGRARQMNAGAAVASGDALLFLHADTRLPPDALARIEQALARHDWGRFDVRIAGKACMLRVIAQMMNWRSRLTGIATGDQALFMTRAAFEQVGGFPELPLMEDVELSKRLNAISPPACIASRATTSGRRWETRGVWRTIFLMWRLRFDYWRGVDAAQLAERYR